MELWQEAYKAIEDIHGLMILSKKVFQPKMMANYYQKLALVFLKCGNQLFHAAAIFKYFQLTREMKKNISAEELGKLASRGIFQKKGQNFLKIAGCCKKQQKIITEQLLVCGVRDL